MDMKAYFLRLYEYSYWANHAALEAAQSLSVEQFERQIGPSWGSVRDTLVHIMGAEWIWLSRWQGVSPREMLRGEDFPTPQAIGARWSQIEADLHGFLKSLNPERLGEEIAYTTTGGQQYALKLWQMLAHVVNHGSHHRGELADMYTELGVAHPQDDMNAYFLRSRGQ